MRVVPSRLLPIKPTLDQYVIRCVRHGLADILAQLGEDVGPTPTEETHALRFGDTLLVSHETYEAMSEA